MRSKQQRQRSIYSCQCHIASARERHARTLCHRGPAPATGEACARVSECSKEVNRGIILCELCCSRATGMGILTPNEALALIADLVFLSCERSRGAAVQSTAHRCDALTYHCHRHDAPLGLRLRRLSQRKFSRTAQNPNAKDKELSHANARCCVLGLYRQRVQSGCLTFRWYGSRTTMISTLD